MRELRGGSAIVTGGAVRIGRALAERLAREGMNVCVHYSSSAAEATKAVEAIRECGVQATSVQADLRDGMQAAHRVVAHAAREFGRVDVLVNSAAIFEPGRLADTDSENWDRHLEINLKAPFCLSREFAAQLGNSHSGQIVNIVDWRGMRPGTGHLAYTVSKAGLVALTKILALELAPRVQVNAIAPGPILPAPGHSPADFQAVGAATPLQRTGRPDDITDALVYLLKSEYVTGEILHVTGGEHL